MELKTMLFIKWGLDKSVFLHSWTYNVRTVNTTVKQEVKRRSGKYTVSPEVFTKPQIQQLSFTWNPIFNLRCSGLCKIIQKAKEEKLEYIFSDYYLPDTDIIPWCLQYLLTLRTQLFLHLCNYLIDPYWATDTMLDPNELLSGYCHVI